MENKTFQKTETTPLLNTDETEKPQPQYLTVLVTNIVARPNENLVQSLSEFFSYCGKITNLYVEQAELGAFKAYITFDHAQSVETALVINGTTFNGVNIKIERAPFVDIPIQTEGIKNKPELPQGLQTMTNVMSNLITGGYKLSQDVLGKAKEFDEKVGITDKLKDTKDKVQHKVEEIGGTLDEKLKITEKIDTVQSKFKEVEGKLDLGTKTKEIGEQTKSVVQTIGSTVQTNVQSMGNDVENFIEKHETLKKGVDQVKKIGDFLWSTGEQIVGTVGNVINETTTQVKEKIQETDQENLNKDIETKLAPEPGTNQETQVL